jgi:hypothetical protein
MHCRFEDVESGRVIEVEFAHEEDAAAGGEPIAAQAEQVQSYQVQ